MLFNQPNLGEFMNEQESTIIGNNNTVDQDTNIDINMSGNNMMMGEDLQMTTAESQTPIMEPMQERVVNRTIMHNVPHV